jgi:surfactin synthase thioesterase subunit
MSSIRFAPLTGYQSCWKRLGAMLPRRILIFAGTTDPIIVHHELRPDADELLGRENFEWRLIEGAHDFPILQAGRVVSGIAGFWGI